MQQSLAALNNDAIPAAVVWLWFGIHLLHVSGHALNVVTNSQGQAMQAKDKFLFDYQNMAFYAHVSGMYTSQHVKLIRLSQSASQLQLTKIQNVADIAAELQQLIMECIKHGLH